MVRQKRLHFPPSKIFLTMCLASGNLSDVEFVTRPRGLGSLARTTGPHLLNLGELQKVLQCDALSANRPKGRTVSLMMFSPLILSNNVGLPSSPQPVHRSRDDDEQRSVP